MAYSFYNCKPLIFNSGWQDYSALGPHELVTALLGSNLRINISIGYKKKSCKRVCLQLFLYNVGVAGFEPTTSCSQSRRDTGLRYTPKVRREGDSNPR